MGDTLFPLTPTLSLEECTAPIQNLKLTQGAFKQVGEPGRGRLVPVNLSATDKTRGRSRPRPSLERTLELTAPGMLTSVCPAATRVFRSPFRNRPPAQVRREWGFRRARFPWVWPFPPAFGHRRVPRAS